MTTPVGTLRRWWTALRRRRDEADWFPRFNEEVRTALVAAQDEAIRRGAGAIQPGHLLLGLVANERGIIAWAFDGLNTNRMVLRDAVAATMGHRNRAPEGPVGLSPEGKQVIELTVVEAQRLGDAYVGPEHLLLAILRHGSAPAKVLAGHGCDLVRLRQWLTGATEAPASDAPAN